MKNKGERELEGEYLHENEKRNVGEGTSRTLLSKIIPLIV